MRTVVYVDGFNLYYGCLKHTPYKWLDISKVCGYLFPNDTITAIKYFTAPIKLRVSDVDTDKPNRQQMYLRALRTISRLEIIEGHFLVHSVMMKNANSKGFLR